MTDEPNTRPTPAERPVPQVSQEALDWATSQIPEIEAFKAANPDWEKDCLPARDVIRPSPVPQVREALAEPRFQALRKRLLHAITTASNDDISEPMSEKRLRHAERVAAMYVAIDFIDAALTARPSDAAVAWRYRHKDTEGWLMLQNGRDPTEWLKQWPNTEYEVEALAPMRPEAADEIERLRNQLVSAHGALRGIDKIVRTPTKVTRHRTAHDHFQSDFDAIRKLIMTELAETDE